MKHALFRFQEAVLQFTAEQVWLCYYVISSAVIWFINDLTILKVMACVGWMVAILLFRKCYTCNRNKA